MPWGLEVTPWLLLVDMGEEALDEIEEVKVKMVRTLNGCQCVLGVRAGEK